VRVFGDLFGGFANDLHTSHEGAFENFVAKERRLVGPPRLALQKLRFAHDVAQQLKRGRKHSETVGRKGDRYTFSVKSY